MKLADFYSARGSCNDAERIYEKIFRRVQVAINYPSLFYKLSPAQSYFLNKKLWDHYRDKDPVKATIIYRILSRYEMLKELCPFVFQNYSVKLDNDNAGDNRKETICPDDFQDALIREFGHSPYWRYQAAIDFSKKNDIQKAKIIFQGLLSDFPYCLATQEQLSRIETGINASLDLPLDLVGMWKLDKDKNHIAKDSSGGGKHGIIYGAKAVIDEGKQALQFSGKNDYIEIVDDEELVLSKNITIAFWLKVYSWAETYTVHLVEKYRSYSDAMLMVFLGGPTMGDKLQVLASCAGNWQAVSSPSSLKLNQWYYVAWTYSEEGGLLYINGIPQGDKIKAGKRGEARGALLRLGVGDFHGLLADLIIFNRALSEKEIKNLYETAQWTS
jgi:hypothetical protein